MPESEFHPVFSQARRLRQWCGVVGLTCLLGVPASCSGDGEGQPAQTTKSSEASSGVAEMGSPTGKTDPVGIDWTKDARIKNIAVKCYEKGRFKGDTSDMLPVLVEKLQASQRSVLRNVREELARLGEPALMELQRVIHRVYSDRHSSPIIVNALSVFSLSSAGSSKTGRAVFKSCLGHPLETIRIATVRALANHSAPEMFDDLKALLPVTTENSQQELLIAMFKANPAGTRDLALEWILKGEFPELQDSAARLLAASKDLETAQIVGLILPMVSNRRILALLTVTQEVLEGGSEALGVIDAMLKDEDVGVRGDGISALEFTSRVDWMIRVLQDDNHPDMRSRALSLIKVQPESEEIHKALTQALQDSSPTVREAAMMALLERGDENAADSALELWSGGISKMGAVTRAMSGNWDANPGMAAKVLALLKDQYQAQADGELKFSEAWIQAMAQVPGPQSTQFLLDEAHRRVGEIKGYSAHRFFTLQASNTGPRGHELLWGAWRQEQDVERRFDLLWAGTVGHDDATREFLIEALQAERTLPHERLWVAERLAQEGPASRVAPLIKRATLRMNHPDFRPSMECLLWRWFGPPR
jgi:hypothetical protein